jgi:hypothetical protein
LSRLRDFCFSYFWRHSIRETVANPMLPFSPCSPRSLKSHEYILRLHAIRRKRFSFPPFWVDSSELRGPNGILKIHSSSLDNQMLTEWFVMGRNDAMFFGCTQNK